MALRASHFENHMSIFGWFCTSYIAATTSKVLQLKLNGLLRDSKIAKTKCKMKHRSVGDTDVYPTTHVIRKRREMPSVLFIL